MAEKAGNKSTEGGKKLKFEKTALSVYYRSYLPGTLIPEQKHW